MGVGDALAQDTLTKSAIQRYASLPLEELQVKAKILGDTPQGLLVQSLLKQKLAALESSGIVGQKSGGSVSGSQSTSKKGAEGYLNGGTLGRADALNTSAPSGSYIIPADIVSGWGEGNSNAGARVWDHILSTLPEESGYAKGGEVESPSDVPVLLSHGEIAINPRDVRRIGGGDIKRGHRIMDALIRKERQKLIKKLKSLPGPVRA